MAITNTPPPRPGLQVGPTPDGGAQRRVVDLRAIGSQGLRQASGLIYEEPLKELKGTRALEEFKAMSLNDATCSAIIYAIDKLVRQVPWTVAQASQEDFDIEAAEFLTSCFDDMEYPFHEVLSEIVCGMLIYGHSLHEVVYKRRGGDSPEPQLNSAFNDGHIGWRDFAVRAQDTIWRWIYDDNGRLLGAEQNAPPKYQLVYLPMDKCLLFRTSSEKGSPLGKSIFRGAYRSWSIKTSLENIEAVGVEKDLVGIPVVKIPIELIQQAETGDTDALAVVEAYKNLATNLRRNHQEGVVMGTSYDENNNSQFDLSLLSGGGSRQFNVSEIISRYDRNIARSVLADFLFLGDGVSAGSWAMHKDKSALFLSALGVFLTGVADTINRKAVVPLLKLNGFQMSKPPRFEFGSLEQKDIGALSDTILKLSQAGMPIFPNAETEAFIRETVGLPEVVENYGDMDNIEAQPQAPQAPHAEVHGAPALPPDVHRLHEEAMAAAARPPAPGKS